MAKEYISVLITSFNRKKTTLTCLDSLFLAAGEVENIYMQVILVDDASTDGTTEAVCQQFPDVQIIHGNGSLYWGGGMRVAQSAVNTMFPGSILWLNDDVALHKHALVKLINTRNNCLNPERSIIVGCVCSRISRHYTYGGRIRRKSLFRRLRFDLECSNVALDTFNGNIVLLPNLSQQKVGLISKFMQHSLGDFDYGLRLKKKGYLLQSTSQCLGYCEVSPETGTFVDGQLSKRDRLQKILHVKGIPFTSWFVFCFRHAGIMAPLYIIWPYIKILFQFSIRDNRK